ncbi:MAG: ABC transporter transmembrane domain-containing protein, partial [Campylobacterales bacterium]|nr:ABC transporter transmembrane domain-containing protein [Campylobacterales bacterium]
MSYTNSQGLIYSFKYILDFYYGDVPIKTILLMSGSDDEHFSLESVIDVSKEVNLHVELQKIQPERVSKHLLPVILYKESLPPLVLLKLDKDEATLFDGKENSVVTKKISELKEYDSVVYFFRDKSDKEFIQERKKEKEWFFKPIKEEWRSYTEVAILTVFINIFILAVPLYTMSVYDRVIPNFATNTLKVLAFGVVIILIFDFIFKGVRSYIIENVGKRLGNSLEEELMNKILHIQPKYDEIQVGAKVNLFSELSRVKEFFASKTMINILDFPFFLFMMFVIYLISPTLASIPFFGALIILGVSYFIHLIGDRLREDSFEHVQSKNSFLVETIGGRDSIKLANASPKRLFEFRQLIGFTNSIILKLQMFNV